MRSERVGERRDELRELRAKQMLRERDQRVEGKR